MNYPSWIENRRKGRKRSENKFVTSCVFGYWVGRCFCSRRSRDAVRLLTFRQLVKKSQEIFLSPESGGDIESKLISKLYEERRRALSREKEKGLGSKGSKSLPENALLKGWSMKRLKIFWNDYVPVGQRRERCIFSLARRKAVYGLDVAMFVSLIVTWWRCPSTPHSGNLISPSFTTWTRPHRHSTPISWLQTISVL